MIWYMYTVQYTWNFLRQWIKWSHHTLKTTMWGDGGVNLRQLICLRDCIVELLHCKTLNAFVYLFIYLYEQLLLRYNPHTMHCTSLKCTIQSFSVYSYMFTCINHHCLFLNIIIISKKILKTPLPFCCNPQSSHLPPPIPRPRQPLIYFLSLEISLFGAFIGQKCYYLWSLRLISLT